MPASEAVAKALAFGAFLLLSQAHCSTPGSQATRLVRQDSVATGCPGDAPAQHGDPVSQPAVTTVSFDRGVVDQSLLPLDPVDMAAAVFTLDHAIEAALAANPDLVSASEQIGIADATLARARAEFYPRLGISEQYGLSNNPVTAFSFRLNQAQLSLSQDFNNPKATDDFHTQFRLQHRVYAGQQRTHELHAAEAQLSSAACNLAAVQNQMAYRVAEAYYRLLQARDLVDLRREAIDQVEQHLRIVQTRFRNDTAVRSDVLSVEVRLSEVRESFISAENQLALSWAVLENVVGRSLERRPLPQQIPPAPWSDHVRETQVAVQQALSARPEVGGLASQRQAAAEGMLVAEAGKRLTIDLVADYDVFTGDFSRGNDGFFVGLIFNLNLFDGGRTRAEVSKATARWLELRARERRLVLDIELDVRRAYLRLNDGVERFKVATQAIEQARETLREIEIRYENQSATITRLIDAQVALSNARVRRANAQAEVEISRTELERATGRLADLLR